MRILIIFIFSLFATFASAETIIVNPQTQVGKKITVEEAREIFLLKRQRATNGIKFQVFILSRDSLAMRQFILEVLGMSPTSYFDTLDALAASGKLTMPVVVASDSKMVVSVASNPGGVGFLRNLEFADSDMVSIVLIK